MNKVIYIFLCAIILCSSLEGEYYVVTNEKYNEKTSYLGKNGYEPTWDSLDNRSLPSWYDDYKVGIFIHWGVFSVPSFGSEWFWNNWQEEQGSSKYNDFMKARYPPNFTYQDFARDFTAEFFNASDWSEIFQKSGAKYVVITSKHHEGYTLWPSSYSFSWNSMDVGPRRDLIGELAGAIRNETNLKFGLYHSLYEWYNPLWLFDKKHNFTTNLFTAQKVNPELKELVLTYKPEILWSDGDWEATEDYWKSKEFLVWLYNDSPVKETIVVNDRWGKNTNCHHGDFYTCTDRYNPGVLIPHKWENCQSLDKKSWGFRRDASLADYFTLKELVKELVITVSCGGNLLVNIGPTKDGIISPIFQDRLQGLGSWLLVNGEGIYETKPWSVQNDTTTGNVWYTQSKNHNVIYAHLLEWPKDGQLYLGSVNSYLQDQSEISLLGFHPKLEWKRNKNNIIITLLAEIEKGQSAWVLKIINKKS